MLVFIVPVTNHRIKQGGRFIFLSTVVLAEIVSIVFQVFKSREYCRVYVDAAAVDILYRIFPSAYIGFMIATFVTFLRLIKVLVFNTVVLIALHTHF